MIEVENLAFTYPRSQVPALRGCSFTVAEGEVFGFLGPSGAGKSTAQKILMGLLHGFEGSVRVMGRDLAAWGPDYYERVGVSFEFPNHYLKLTAAENLDYFRRLYAGPTEAPMDLLDAVGLADDAHRRVEAFSKGMRARLNLARALLHRPALLFLDEPTAGLDPVSSRRIRDLLRVRRAAGTTLFLTTHDMHVADALCDRVAFLVDGRIADVDTPRDFKLRHGRRAVRVEYTTADGPAVRDFPLDGLADNAAFLQTLRGEPLQTLHTLEPTLEDVFIEVTGRRLDVAV